MSQPPGLLEAVEKALAGEWNNAHAIVQGIEGAAACRVHAALHRIEGDRDNAAYWYSRAGTPFDERDPQTQLREELEALRRG
jgi:hypothetical protein